MAVVAMTAAAPDWNSWENQENGIAVTHLDGKGQTDLIRFHIASWSGQN